MSKHYDMIMEKGDDHPYQHPYRGVDMVGWKFMIDKIFKDTNFKVNKKLI
jgi:hypothetical protein